jgi:Flp pilus assembly protein TadD
MGRKVIYLSIDRRRFLGSWCVADGRITERAARFALAMRELAHNDGRQPCAMSRGPKRKRVSKITVKPADAFGSNPRPAPPPGALSQQGPRPDVNQRRVVAGVCLVLVVLVWAVFGQTLAFGFVNFDDDHYVYDNSHITGGLSMASARWAFTHFHDHNWHPLTTLSHLLDCQLYGLQAGGHHATNVILHNLAAILLFIALRKMTGALWRSGFVAAVFAVHPLHVESVAWISERKDVLSGVFFALTLCAYSRYVAMQNFKSGIKNEEVQRGRCKTWVSYGAVVVCSAMALMCKPTMVTLPFILLLMDWWPLGRSAKRGVRSGEWRGRRWLWLVLEKVPIFAMSAAVCAATICAQRGSMEQSEGISSACRIGNAAVSYVAYLAQMAWPANLAALYPFRCDALPAREVAAALVILAMISIAVWAGRRRRPWLLTGWLWYVGTLVPMIGLVQVGIQSHADRYTYLSQVGLYVALTWWAAEAGTRWFGRAGMSGVKVGGVIVTLALAAGAAKQTSYWHDSESLWRHTLACTGENHIAHNDLGLALQQRGRLEDAIAEYEKALEIFPDYAYGHYNLGLVYEAEGRLDEAAARLQEAINLNPANASFYNDLGIVLGRMGRLDEAVARYQRALEIDPTYPQVHNNLGIAREQQGRAGEAAAEYELALRWNPNYVNAEVNLARLLATSQNSHLRNGARALELAQRANLLTSGRNPLVLAAVAAACAEQSRYPEALTIQQQAIETATRQGNNGLADELRQALSLYQAGRPLRSGP